ncbi:Progestin and AdipoQ Receptor family [Aphelenchoides besseyi]|nr:Progestin and AdipoQ Receptor family [Aphelenchoides besseyi]
MTHEFWSCQKHSRTTQRANSCRFLIDGNKTIRFLFDPRGWSFEVGPLAHEVALLCELFGCWASTVSSRVTVWLPRSTMKPRCLSCKTAAHCRRHNRILRLLHRDELPRSLWINEHIHTAYRPPNLTLWLCIRSALQWNNETLNIWSHLLGFFYFLYMQLNNLFVVLPNLNATQTDYLVCFLSVGGSQICMCLSVFYHTFGCIDQQEHDKWLKADVFGISAGLIGMYLSGIYLSFYCFANEMTTYLMALCFILLITIYVPIKSHLFQTKFYGTRIGYLHLIYGAIVSFGAYPAIHWIQLHDGFEHPHVVEWFPRLVILFALIGIAFAFYVTLLPERLCPGKFDIFGCSHQWWHLFILSAMIYWHEAGVQLLTYYHSMPVRSSKWPMTLLNGTSRKKELADTGIGRKRWNEMNKNERIRHTITVFVKLVFLVFFIFGFIFILSLLGVAFRLIGGKGLGSAIRHSSFLHNPIAASIIGMVISMVIQNTTTFMSVLVSMVAGRLLTVHEALPFMIGTEIGGSVLNVLVSMAQSGNSDQFRRAFATAVMNDVFNLLNYVVLLPTEMAFGLIEKTSGFLVRPLSHTRTVKVRTLEAFTSPLIQLVVQIDNDAITKIAAMSGNKTAIALLDRPTFIHRCVNMTNGETVEDCSYFHLFAYSTWSDVTIGILLLIISIGTLLGCLVGIVRIMKSLLAGSVAVFVRRVLDHDCPYPFRFLTGYLIMLIGGLIVAIIQSSNVFRSSLIPLAGIGVISLDRIYPLFVGANIGTTSTATLAALSADPSQLQDGSSRINLNKNNANGSLSDPLQSFRNAALLPNSIHATNSDYNRNEIGQHNG